MSSHSKITRFGVVVEHHEIVVACAACGSPYTHFVDVTLFRRDKEDSPTGQRLTYDMGDGKINAGCAVTKSGASNPSERRDGVIIQLSCESCPNLTCLELAQHKGQTLMSLHESQ